ncbi:MAG: hypothetical protein K6F23_10130 [Solobacterium sp.]|nr:hypothetical protein [Solobacterium sp.]
MNRYEFDAVLYELADDGETYSVFLWNIPQGSGKGNIKVLAVFEYRMNVVQSIWD